MNPINFNDPAYIAQLQHIERLIQAQKLQEAASVLNQLVKASPQDARLFLLGAEMARMSGNEVGVLEAARRAQALAPTWFVPAIYLAEALMRQGQKTDAMTLAHQAIDMATQDNAVTVDVLTRAALLAQGANLVSDAWRWLRQALKMAPTNAALQRLMARTLIGMGDASGAVELLTELLEQYPEYHGLRLERLRANLAAEQFDQAALDGQALLVAEPDNQIYAFFLELAQQRQPKTQPLQLVSMVFDGAAQTFDALMVQSLNYRLPEAVAAQVVEWFPARRADILDLGCGTGLFGRYLQPWQGALVGVDASKNMISQAAQHQVYASFHCVNLVDALLVTPADHYDVITALDVFGFVGDLSSVIPGAFRVLTRGGKFVFSFQKLEDTTNDYALDEDLVYHYRSDYVTDLLSLAGFVDVTIKPFNLRLERETKLIGQLVFATKPT